MEMLAELQPYITHLLVLGIGWILGYLASLKPAIDAYARAHDRMEDAMERYRAAAQLKIEFVQSLSQLVEEAGGTRENPRFETRRAED